MKENRVGILEFHCQTSKHARHVENARFLSLLSCTVKRLNIKHTFKLFYFFNFM